MRWPPQAGELLPRAEEAAGIRKKLVAYSLALDHESGGAKALGFARLLGITISSLDYLEVKIRAGICVTPIAVVRENEPHGVTCLVEFRSVASGSTATEWSR
ncbi:MAG: DUF6883 domain-containing protein [Solirubrobacterales bacterium]